MNTPTPKNMQILSKRDSNFAGYEHADDCYAFVRRADWTWSLEGEDDKFKRGLAAVGGAKRGLVGVARATFGPGSWCEYVVIHKFAVHELKVAGLFLELEELKEKLAAAQDEMRNGEIKTDVGISL